MRFSPQQCVPCSAVHAGQVAWHAITPVNVTARQNLVVQVKIAQAKSARTDLQCTLRHSDSISLKKKTPRRQRHLYFEKHRTLDNNLRFSPVSASLVQLLQHASGHGNHNIWVYSRPTPQMYVVATFMTQAPEISVHSLASNLFSALSGTTFIVMDIPDLWTAGTNDLDREPTKSHRIVYTLSLQSMTKYLIYCNQNFIPSIVQVVELRERILVFETSTLKFMDLDTNYPITNKTRNFKIETLPWQIIGSRPTRRRPIVKDISIETAERRLSLH